MIAISTLLSPVTAAQARASAVNQLVSYGIPANNWRAGGVFSTLLTIFCLVFAGFSAAVTSAVNAMFLGTATGGWLTALAYYVYGVTRQVATFGTTSYTLTNTGGGVYSYASGQAVFQCGLNGNTFTNVTAFTLGSGSPGSPSTVTFQIQAQASGSLGGASANTITTIVTTMVGVTGTNATACIGVDQWSDAQVVAACYAALAARSQKGPTGAYLASIYGYSNVPGAVNAVTGAPVNVNRVQVYTNPDTGNITVYLASPAGIADPNDVAGVQTAITAVAQPMGVIATAQSCTVVTFSAAITAWSSSSGSTAASIIQSEALTSVDNALAAYPIGGYTKPPSLQGYLYASFITGAVSSVDPSIYAVDLSSWSALPLSAGQVAGVTSSVTVRQVPA
jgi:hypothetical protein